MYAYRTILNQVGVALIAFWIFDLAYFVYSTLQVQRDLFNLSNSYSSISLAVVVAGVLLLRGHLRTVEIVTWFTALSLSHLVSAMFILLPFLKPADLWAIEFRLDPVGLFSPLVVRVGLIAFLYWIYTRLRAAPVVSAMKRFGYSASTPKLAFILGIALVIFLSSIMQFTH